MSRTEIHHKVFLYSLLTLAASLPLYPKLANITIIVLSANWLFEGGYRVKLQALKNPLVLIFIVFFLVHIVGLLYTENMSVGTFNLEKKLTFLLLPIIISTSDHTVNEKWLDRIMISFVLSCLAFSLICIGHGLYMWQLEHTTLYLLGEDLTDWTWLQSIYFGMYVALAAAILMSFLISRPLAKLQTAGAIVLIGYFFVVMIIMSARMGTLAFALIVTIGGFYYARQRKILAWFVISGVMLAIVGVVLVFKIDYLRERVMSLVETKLYFDPAENNANGLTLRLVKWQCSVEGWSTNPLLGVGTGDTQDFLQSCYKKKGFWGAVFEFNSHNQYLQTVLGLGIIGLISLLTCFIYPAIIALKKRLYLYVAFIVILALSFLTESALERKQGVMFFAFFNSLFVLTLIHNKSKTK